MERPQGIDEETWERMVEEYDVATLRAVQQGDYA